MTTQPAYHATTASARPLPQPAGEGAPILRSARLVLRALAARDVEPFVAYRLSPRARLAYAATSRHDALKNFAEMVGHWTVHGFGRFAIALDETSPAIGHAGPLAGDIGAAPEMTWTLWDGAHEGQGYATEAARTILSHVFAHQGWRSIDALIQPENDASIAVVKRLGGIHDPSAQARPWAPTARVYRIGADA